MRKYLINLNGSHAMFELLILAGCVKALLSVKLTPKEMREKEREKKMEEEIQFAAGGGREWGGGGGGGGGGKPYWARETTGQLKIMETY